MARRLPCALASLLVAASVVAPGATSLGFAGPLVGAPVEGLQQAQYFPPPPPPPPPPPGRPMPPMPPRYDDDYGGRGRCRYWRRECADRWGWETRDYWRCMRRRDC